MDSTRIVRVKNEPGIKAKMTQNETKITHVEFLCMIYVI